MEKGLDVNINKRASPQNKRVWVGAVNDAPPRAGRETGESSDAGERRGVETGKAVKRRGGVAPTPGAKRSTDTSKPVQRTKEQT